MYGNKFYRLLRTLRKEPNYKKLYITRYRPHGPNSAWNVIIRRHFYIIIIIIVNKNKIHTQVSFEKYESSLVV